MKTLNATWKGAVPAVAGEDDARAFWDGHNVRLAALAHFCAGVTSPFTLCTQTETEDAVKQYRTYNFRKLDKELFGFDGGSYLYACVPDAGKWTGKCVVLNAEYVVVVLCHIAEADVWYSRILFREENVQITMYASVGHNMKSAFDYRWSERVYLAGAGCRGPDVHTFCDINARSCDSLAQFLKEYGWTDDAAAVAGLDGRVCVALTLCRDLPHVRGGLLGHGLVPGGALELSYTEMAGVVRARPPLVTDPGAPFMTVAAVVGTAAVRIERDYCDERAFHEVTTLETEAGGKRLIFAGARPFRADMLVYGRPLAEFLDKTAFVKAWNDVAEKHKKEDAEKGGTDYVHACSIM